MEQRIQACSHYCEAKKGKPYLPHNTGLEKNIRHARTFKIIIKDYLTVTKAGSLVYGILKRIYKSLPFSIIFHNSYCSNNYLGIFITASCNLDCFNCQTSAGQAPASDIMTVGQIEKIVNEAINLRYYWDGVFLTGGEPSLHPQFFEILDVLKQYSDFNPECKIFLETNGAGNKVQSVLKKLPSWILIHNTNKKVENHSYDFYTYNIAPIDNLAYRFSDFSKGCRRLSVCYGLCATMYGYYPCSPCMNVARVFGLDIGIKELSLVTEKTLRKQLKILCKYCGWFKEPVNSLVLTEKISCSWKRAFAEYAKQRPKMSYF